jgi:hypothetical protein
MSMKNMAKVASMRRKEMVVTRMPHHMHGDVV